MRSKDDHTHKSYGRGTAHHTTSGGRKEQQGKSTDPIFKGFSVGKAEQGRVNSLAIASLNHFGGWVSTGMNGWLVLGRSRKRNFVF